MAAAAAAVKAGEIPAGRLREVWRTFDFNGNGFLSLAEIDRAVLELLPAMHKHKPAILRAYKAADVSKDGFIQFNEFAGLVRLLSFYDDLWQRFQQLDKNGDRRLSFAEFKQAHSILGLPAGTSDADLKRLFDKLDSNHGGYLLFDEFCIFFSGKLASSSSSSS